MTATPSSPDPWANAPEQPEPEATQTPGELVLETEDDGSRVYSSTEQSGPVTVSTSIVVSGPALPDERECGEVAQMGTTRTASYIARLITPAERLLLVVDVSAPDALDAAALQIRARRELLSPRDTSDEVAF